MIDTIQTAGPHLSGRHAASGQDRMIGRRGTLKNGVYEING